MTTMPGADCGTDHRLVAESKVKLKGAPKKQIQKKYDLHRIDDNYALELKNRFQVLSTLDKSVGQTWTDICDTVKEAAERYIPKANRKKTTLWLSENAIQIAEVRRTARSKGGIKETRRLNRAFQRQNREDKGNSIQEACQRIPREANHRLDKIRDLFREIKKNITSTFQARCAAVRTANNKTVTEEREVKRRWKEYTEKLYKR